RRQKKARQRNQKSAKELGRVARVLERIAQHPGARPQPPPHGSTRPEAVHGEGDDRERRVLQRKPEHVEEPPAVGESLAWRGFGRHLVPWGRTLARAVRGVGSPSEREAETAAETRRSLGRGAETQHCPPEGGEETG